MSTFDSQDLVEAVHAYFKGERLEMALLLLGGVVAISAAAALYWVARDGFAKGFATVVCVTACLLGAAALSLLQRDPRIESALLASLEAPQRTEAVKAEVQRIEAVIQNYPSYRHAGIGLVVLAVLGVLASRQGWVHGGAAGLCLTFAALLLIDHYSSQRALVYLNQLNGPAAGG